MKKKGSQYNYGECQICNRVQFVRLAAIAVADVQSGEAFCQFAQKLAAI